MTDREVTREEAIEWLASPVPSPEWVDAALRTVVALYDEIESVRRMERTAIRALVEIQPEFKARGECIDRLWDGWEATEFIGWTTDVGWHWCKGREFVRMTPDQQAVIRRTVGALDHDGRVT